MLKGVYLRDLSKREGKNNSTLAREGGSGRCSREGGAGIGGGGGVITMDTISYHIDSYVPCSK